MRGQRRYMGVQAEQEPFDGFMIKGKFTDTSTSADWHCKIDNVDVDLTLYVNPDTKEFEYWQKEKPTSLENMFSFNNNLQHIYDIAGTEDCTSFYCIFGYCKNLLSFKAPSINTCKVTDFSYFVRYCERLTDIDVSNFDTSSANSFDIMFGGSSIGPVLDISHFDTHNVTTFHGFVHTCTSLRQLIVNWDLTNIRNGAFLEFASSPIDIIGSIHNIYSSIRIQGQISNNAALLFINGLAEVEPLQTITFDKVTYDTLSPDQIALAESKNWIVANA